VQWINSTSCVDEVVVGPDIGVTASKWLASQTQASTIAVAGMSDVPHTALSSLRHALPNTELRGANAWYAPLETGFTPAPLVAERALQIARTGLSLVTSLTFQGAHDIVAAIDGHCRSNGAEEVAVLLAPDLSRSSLLHRLEGDTSLGECFAVQVSLAYKGCWLRIAGSYRRGAAAVAELPECELARTEVQRGLLGASSDDLAASAASAAKANLDDWSLEARCGGLPLATIACAGHTNAKWVPAFSTLSLQLRAGNVSFVLAEPVAFS
jgi:hypothetical protein